LDPNGLTCQCRREGRGQEYGREGKARQNGGWGWALAMDWRTGGGGEGRASCERELGELGGAGSWEELLWAASW